MPHISLKCHPSTPCKFVDDFEVEADRLPSELRLCYSIHGEIRRLSYPFPGPAHRCDELWKHTCCESFLKPCGGSQYYELNFAPSTSWALYRFSSYRDGMVSAPYPGVPKIRIHLSPKVLELEARIDLKALALLDTPFDLGLAAVIETDEKSLSYWAISHPSAEPDFHHPEAFALSL